MVVRAVVDHDEVSAPLGGRVGRPERVVERDQVTRVRGIAPRCHRRGHLQGSLHQILDLGDPQWRADRHEQRDLQAAAALLAEHVVGDDGAEAVTEHDHGPVDAAQRVPEHLTHRLLGISEEIGVHVLEGPLHELAEHRDADRAGERQRLERRGRRRLGVLSRVMAASAACTSRIDWATNSSGGSTGGGGAASNSEVGASSISSNTASTDDGSGNGCGYRTEAQYAIRDEAPRSLPKRAPSHCCLRSASRTSLPLPWTYTIVMPMLASPQ